MNNRTRLLQTIVKNGKLFSFIWMTQVSELHTEYLEYHVPTHLIQRTVKRDTVLAATSILPSMYLPEMADQASEVEAYLTTPLSWVAVLENDPAGYRIQEINTYRESVALIGKKHEDVIKGMSAIFKLDEIYNILDTLTILQDKREK